MRANGVGFARECGGGGGGGGGRGGVPLRVCVLNVYSNRESLQCILLLLTCFCFTSTVNI